MIAGDVFIFDIAVVKPIIIFVLADFLRLENDNLVATIFLKPFTTTSIVFSQAVTLSDVGASACMGDELVATIVILIKDF